VHKHQSGANQLKKAPILSYRTAKIKIYKYKQYPYKQQIKNKKTTTINIPDTRVNFVA
jgi:hypothetical protein